MRKFTSEILNRNDEVGGKSGPFARPEAAPQGRVVEQDKTACAIC